MNDVKVGDKISLMWPKKHPMCRLVGHVVSVDDTAFGPEVTVRFADDKPPHKVLLDQAKIYTESQKAECGFWMRVQKG